MYIGLTKEQNLVVVSSDGGSRMLHMVIPFLSSEEEPLLFEYKRVK
jgi:hypothetical protein